MAKKNIEEISTHHVLVTETNINNTAIIDSRDIAISENVDTNTMNSSLTITKTVNESRETNLSSIPFLLMEMYLTESSNPNTKPDEINTTISLNDSRPEEKNSQELNISQISVTATNINTNDVTESSDIASRPNVVTHMTKAPIINLIASIFPCDSDVKLDDTKKTNVPHDVTPKENTDKELQTCKFLVTDAHPEAKEPEGFRNIACLPKVPNKKTNSNIANTTTSIESSDIANAPKVLRNTNNTRVTTANDISQQVVKPKVVSFISNIPSKKTKGWGSSATVLNASSWGTHRNEGSRFIGSKSREELPHPTKKINGTA